MVKNTPTSNNFSKPKPIKINSKNLSEPSYKIDVDGIIKKSCIVSEVSLKMLNLSHNQLYSN